MNKTRNEQYLKAFGDHLRKVRKKQGMTMMQLAFEADIEYSQIAKIERGVNNVTVSTVYLISTALGVKPTELFDFHFPPKAIK